MLHTEYLRVIVQGHTRVTTQYANMNIMQYSKGIYLIWMSSLLQVWLEIVRVGTE